jgi:hypothetical protein
MGTHNSVGYEFRQRAHPVRPATTKHMQSISSNFFPPLNQTGALFGLGDGKNFLVNFSCVWLEELGIWAHGMGHRCVNVANFDFLGRVWFCLEKISRKLFASLTTNLKY